LRKRLTEKQQRFIDEYMKDLNATKAAIRAGYSEKGANSIGGENARKPHIKAAIDKRLAEIKTVNVASAQEVEEYLTRVMRGDSNAEIVIVEGQGEGVSSARRMQKAPDEKERLKAAELLAKRHGLLETKLKLDGALPVFFTGEKDLKD